MINNHFKEINIKAFILHLYWFCHKLNQLMSIFSPFLFISLNSRTWNQDCLCLVCYSVVIYYYWKPERLKSSSKKYFFWLYSDLLRCTCSYPLTLYIWTAKGSYYCILKLYYSILHCNLSVNAFCQKWHNIEPSSEWV